MTKSQPTITATSVWGIPWRTRRVTSPRNWCPVAIVADQATPPVYNSRWTWLCRWRNTPGSVSNVNLVDFVGPRTMMSSCCSVTTVTEDTTCTASTLLLLSPLRAIGVVICALKNSMEERSQQACSDMWISHQVKPAGMQWHVNLSSGESLGCLILN